MTDEPRNYRLTIRHTLGGDISKTMRVETFDMTLTEYEGWFDRWSKQLNSWLAHQAALDQPRRKR